MLQEGIYKPIRYRWKEVYNIRLFTYNLQILLAVLSFSLFIVTLLSPIVGRWWGMLADLNQLEWVAFILGSIVVLAFIGLSAWSLISLVILAIRGWIGQKIKYDPGKTPPEVREAILPLKSKKGKIETTKIN